MTDMCFEEHTGAPIDFFKILPQDWRDLIEPIWPHYGIDSRIYVLKDEGEIIAGGIVNMGIPADMALFANEVAGYSGPGFRYLGYIWVRPEYRGRGLGSEWIRKVRETFPGEALWLSTEDPHLASFYTSLGFHKEAQLGRGDSTEWLWVG